MKKIILKLDIANIAASLLWIVGGFIIPIMLNAKYHQPIFFLICGFAIFNMLAILIFYLTNLKKERLTYLTILMFVSSINLFSLFLSAKILEKREQIIKKDLSDYVPDFVITNEDFKSSWEKDKEKIHQFKATEEKTKEVNASAISKKQILKNAKTTKLEFERSVYSAYAKYVYAEVKLTLVNESNTYKIIKATEEKILSFELVEQFLLNYDVEQAREIINSAAHNDLILALKENRKDFDKQ